MKQKSIPIYFDDARMAGVATIRLEDNGSFSIVGGSDTDPKIAAEEMKKIGAIMLLTEGSGIINYSDDASRIEKVLTPTEWMSELRRWWNYEEIGNMATIKLTRTEFLDYMDRVHATEVTHQIPKELRG